jgi:hypothetical protein
VASERPWYHNKGEELRRVHVKDVEWAREGAKQIQRCCYVARPVAVKLAARCMGLGSRLARRLRASRRPADATSLLCLTSRDRAIPPTPLGYGVFAPVTLPML